VDGGRRAAGRLPGKLSEMTALSRKLMARVPARTKRGAKHIVAAAIGVRLRLSARKVGLALCYHRVGDPPGDPERELVPALGNKTFEAQLRHLKGRYRAVRASELQSAVTRRRRGQRLPVAVTFDDDLPSHEDDAARVLDRVGVPGTFFLCGASLNGSGSFWWQRLQRAWDRGLVDSEQLQRWGIASGDDHRKTIREVAARIRALTPAQRRRLDAELAKLAGPDPPGEGMRAAEVRALAERGFEIGFHTLRHDEMTSLDDDELNQAVTDGRDAVAAASGRPLRSIAYPHGQGDPRVAAAAREAGFEFGFTALGSAVSPGDDPCLLDRTYPAAGFLGDFALDVARRLAAGGPTHSGPG
jgi:peptidoglycan/xylan/chitin deacetylase (PgdA/CDA1 family)